MSGIWSRFWVVALWHKWRHNFIPSISARQTPPPRLVILAFAIKDTNDLSAFTSGLSIVTNQTLHLLDAFNKGTTQPPTSVYAPQVRYGISAISPQVNLTGQVAVVATPAPGPSPTTVNPLSFTNGNGGSIGSSN